MGSPRLTFDLDLCYRRTRENLERLANALGELQPTLRDAPPDLKFRLDAESLALGRNFTFRTALGDLDLLSWVEPLGDFDALDRQSQSVTVGDLDLRVIALDDLIAIKRHLGRPKDQQSLLQLLAIKSLRDAQSAE
jgi:hypothetical protein